MCGIAGVWNYVGAARSEAAVGNMLHAMRHRGPDGAGRLTFEGGAAGMVRLALVDLSSKGQQPMWSANNQVAILFNGEIYNFRELRADFSRDGTRFHSQTDTEVVLEAYLRIGQQFVERLRGMFAIAIFDWRETRPGGVPQLILARDPFGMKPLYVAEAADQVSSVVFASEVRALLASRLVARNVDREAVAEYLSSGFIYQPRTIIQGVRMLERGTIEVHTPEAAVVRRRFWSMPQTAPVNESLEESADRLRSVLDESVKLHAFADAPVGAFLSGGIDSTAIVSLMHRQIPKLRTYTLRFPEMPLADESAEAADFAQQNGIENQPVDVLGRDVAEALPRFAADLDQPSADGLNSWLVSRAAARDVKGVLSGLGGDEWFAGYPVTRRMAATRTSAMGAMFAVIGRIAHLLRALPWNGRYYDLLSRIAARRGPLPLWMYAHSVYRWAHSRRSVGLNCWNSSRDSHYEKLLAEISDSWRSESTVGLSCLLDVGTYMGHQLLRDSDAASMAHSLELRMPFVDVELAQFSRTCLDQWKLAPRQNAIRTYDSTGAKRVLVRSLKDILPPTILAREKRGFTLPHLEWMRTDLAELVEETASPAALSMRGIIDPSILPQTWRDFRHPSAIRTRHLLWPLVIFELWCREILDAGVQPAERVTASYPTAIRTSNSPSLGPPSDRR
jgi:asparagine synthase (glutamine-hydrolysing)